MLTALFNPSEIGSILTPFGASLIAQTVKESACNAGDLGSIPGSERSPGEGNGYLSTSVFLPREFHGQRSLAGYSSWGRKESDTPEAT